MEGGKRRRGRRQNKAKNRKLVMAGMRAEAGPDAIKKVRQELEKAIEDTEKTKTPLAAPGPNASRAEKIKYIKGN